MYPFGRKTDEPSLAWSRDEDRKDVAPRSFFSLFGGKKKKKDDDDDDDLPGPNATARILPLLAFFGNAGNGPIATA